MAEIESDISRMLNAAPDPSPAYVEAYDAPPPDEHIDFPIQRYDSQGRLMTQQDLIQQNFLDAIEKGNTEMVQLLIDSQNVNINPEFGRLPLAVAVKTGQTTLARLFITKYGAEVDRLSDEGRDGYGRNSRRILRTPLMLAAQRGSLPLVKMLMEEFGADDAVIAPDGMNALRLAVLKGEDAAAVVEYLPVRRGGGWLRFKHDHYQAMRRIKRTTRGLVWIGKALFWHIPKFFFWSLPKWVGKKLGKAGKHFFTVTLPWSIKAFADGMKTGAIKLKEGFKWLVKTMFEFVKSIPQRSVKLAIFLTKTTPIYLWQLCKTAAANFGGGLKKFFMVGLPYGLSVSWKACVSGGVALKDAIKWGGGALRTFFMVHVPRFSKFVWKLCTHYIPKFLWKVTKALAKWTKSLITERIPALTVSFAKLLKKGAINTWGFLVKGVSLIASSIHTTVFWIASRFGQVSFKDVMRSIGKVFAWIFFQLPGKIYVGGVATVQWAGKAIEKLFGWVGKVAVFLVKCLAVGVLYIPLKIAEFIAEFFRWIGRGFREIAVWINPKSGF